MTLTYTPDDDVHVHQEGAIRLICAAFQSHENGLPEWLKNASDEYARQQVGETHRVIVLLTRSATRDRASSISVLDFNGMTSSVIETRFRQWADPQASQGKLKDQLVQGGHGNGGKCYMTMMFEANATITTVKNSLGNRYGVPAGSVQFGYVPNRSTGRDFPVVDERRTLDDALTSVGASFASLPAEAQSAFEALRGFTLVTGVTPRGYPGRIPTAQLLEQVRNHPQMMATLQFCDVYIVAEGKLSNHGQPLQLDIITPVPHFVGERVVELPRELLDPVSSEVVRIGAHGRLSLRTSLVSMRYGLKARHVIAYRGSSGFVGYKAIREFDVQSAYRDKIYGDCALSDLESVKQNQRSYLADSPLTRAVESFISTEIQRLAKEFEQRDHKDYDERERDELSRLNDALDRWKNQFLSSYMGGLSGPGEGPEPPPAPPLPAGVPDRIEVALSHPRAGIGVSFRPRAHFYDKRGGRIKPTPHRWVSNDTNVAAVDEALEVVTTFSPGTTEVWAETLDGSIQSNRVPLQVVRIHRVELEPRELEVGQWGRKSIQATCYLASGEGLSDVYLVWLENDPTIARVSSAGNVFGHAPGVTEVLAGDDKCMSDTPSVITVVASRDGDDGNTGRSGVPKVLISAIDDDPLSGEKVQLAADDPPVYQRAVDVDMNVWWINSSAPLAELYLSASLGYGYQTAAWRMYHVERYIEIIIQIALANAPNPEPLDTGSWFLKWGERAAEIQAAAATGLRSFISTGEAPLE